MIWIFIALTIYTIGLLALAILMGEALREIDERDGRLPSLWKRFALLGAALLWPAASVAVMAIIAWEVVVSLATGREETAPTWKDDTYQEKEAPRE